MGNETMEAVNERIDRLIEIVECFIQMDSGISKHQANTLLEMLDELYDQGKDGENDG